MGQRATRTVRTVIPTVRRNVGRRLANDGRLLTKGSHVACWTSPSTVRPDKTGAADLAVELDGILRRPRAGRPRVIPIRPPPGTVRLRRVAAASRITRLRATRRSQPRKEPRRAPGSDAAADRQQQFLHHVAGVGVL